MGTQEPVADELPERVGRYRIVSRIGRGGMGILFRAEDEMLRRPVALKMLPASLEPDDERRRRFLHEARVSAAINHPNVAGIHEVLEVDGKLVLAMEYIAGR